MRVLFWICNWIMAFSMDFQGKKTIGCLHEKGKGKELKSNIKKQQVEQRFLNALLAARIRYCFIGVLAFKTIDKAIVAILSASLDLAP